MTEEPDQVRDLVVAGLTAWSIPYSDRQIEQLIRYRDLLIDWNNNRMNLTRLVTPRDVAVEHFLDSLSVLTIIDIPLGGHLLDIGAGAGFPSLPLKILRPDLQVTLIEATAKKLTFCRAVVDDLGLGNVQLIHTRAEQPFPRLRRHFDIVTARAVASLDKLAVWCEPFIKQRSGVIVAYKGVRAAEELHDAKSVLQSLRLSAEIRSVDIPGSEKAHELVVCRSNAL